MTFRRRGEEGLRENGRDGGYDSVSCKWKDRHIDFI